MVTENPSFIDDFPVKTHHLQGIFSCQVWWQRRGVPLHSQDIPGRSKLRYCVAPETKRDMRCFYGGGGNFLVDGWKKLFLSTGESWFSLSKWQVWGYTLHFQTYLFWSFLEMMGSICFGSAVWSILSEGSVRYSWLGIHSCIYMAGWNHPMSCRRCTPEISGRCSANGGWKTIRLIPPQWSQRQFFLNAHPQSQRFFFFRALSVKWFVTSRGPDPYETTEFFLAHARWPVVFFCQFGTAISDPWVKLVSK